ncbi:MAG TPA: TolC family protein [Bacteroidia bacterium]|nr:TolC family protein [Bacteroidia bacterium]
MKRIRFDRVFFLIATANICFYSQLKAQQIMPLDSAIAIGLKNNYNILIAKSNAQIAKNNNTYGAAGFLPQVSLNATKNLTNSNINQKYSSGLDVNKSGVPSSALNTGAALNWTLFDGFKMFATRQELQQLNDMSELAVKDTIENKVISIVAAYYNVVQQKEMVKVTDDAITLYDEQVKIAQEKFAIGSGSKLDLLQAEVDRNAEKANLLKENVALDNSKTTLNQLLEQPVDMDFDVSDSIVTSYNPTLDQLKSQVEKQNYNLKIAQNNLLISQSLIKIKRSEAYPELGLGLNYNFTRSNTTAGFLLQSQISGLTGGLTASWTIFNGFGAHRDYKNAVINSYESSLQLKNAEVSISASLLQAYKQHQADLEMLKLEEDNYSVAQENISVALESFKLGSTSGIALKQAQDSFENAGNSLVNARYQAKLSEIKLMQLNGMLVK